MQQQQPKFYLHLFNNNLEGATVEIRSTVQLASLFQKGVVPLAYVNSKHETKAIMRIEAFLQQPSETSASAYLNTVARYSLTLENYNGLEVYTVAMPKAEGYSWESDYASFKNEQTATAHLIKVIMERIGKELEKNASTDTGTETDTDTDGN